MRRVTQVRVRRARLRARGFTLVELSVSLVAGLIVTLAVIGLARTATVSFHEQVRSTATETVLRTASERLRLDLARAAYMSTGNIRFDPGIARLKTDPAATGARDDTLLNFTSIRLHKAGVAPAGGTAAIDTLQSDNLLAAQAIDIAGNFTSNDQYLGTLESAAGGCGKQRILLNNDDPAVIHVLIDEAGAAKATAAADLKAIFVPVAGESFIARVTDPSGRTHFALACDAGVTSGRGWIELNTTTGNPVLSGADTAGKGGAEGFGQVTVAPIQIVRWSLQRVANTLLDPTEDAEKKFDLVRQYVLNKGGALPVAVGSPEIAAEFAVDLRFAFTVEPIGSAVESFTFEDETNNELWASSVATVTNAVPGPQRIRSVRFRMAVRTPLPDRTATLPGPATGYVLRYCLDGPHTDCKRFSRVRTLLSEVDLVNQTRMSY